MRLSSISLVTVVYCCLLLAQHTRASQAAARADGAAMRDVPSPRQPNFVIIMTDDQGDLLDDTCEEVMPELHKLLISQGQRFLNYFVTTPICCPSRISFYRAQYETNHNYTDVLGPDAHGVGGYSKFKELRIDNSYLPSWLQSLGYNTYLTGKFIVDYNVRNYQDMPKGWTDMDALLTPYLFQYYDPVFSRNGDHPRQYPGMYSTDVVASKALGYLQTAVAAGKPFFLQINPIAPHFSSGGPQSPRANGSIVPGDISVPHYPPLPAPRHWHLFNDRQVPKPLLAFNEQDVSDKPAWIRSLPRLSRTNLTYLEEIYRNRLRALRAVDELLGRVVRQLEQLRVLDNTYVIFTSDNGYHMGTHRRASGKLSAYEEDIRVPFVIRGPGLRPNHTVLHQCAHVDIGPTLLVLAGAKAPEEVDGHPLPLVWEDTTAHPQPPTHSDTSGPHIDAATRHDRDKPQSARPVGYPDTEAPDAPTRTQFPISYFAGGNGDFDEYFRDVPERKQNDNWTWKSIRVHSPHPATLQPHTDYRDNLISITQSKQDSDDSHTDTHAEDDPGRLYPVQPAFKYIVHCTNEHELYDLHSDPHETSNLLTGSHLLFTNTMTHTQVTPQASHLVLPDTDSVRTSPSVKLKRLWKRVDVLLQALHACWGRSCRYPFHVIHNDTQTPVRTLWDAMDSTYDSLYNKVPWFAYHNCQRYQDYSNERNQYRAILGMFPRGPDGLSLAPINITWATNNTPVHPVPTIHTHHPDNNAPSTARPVTLTQRWQQAVAWSLQAVSRTVCGWVGGACQGSQAYSQSHSQQVPGKAVSSAGVKDDLERYAVPLAAWQVGLTDEQLWGPPGAAVLLA